MPVHLLPQDREVGANAFDVERLPCRYCFYHIDSVSVAGLKPCPTWLSRSLAGLKPCPTWLSRSLAGLKPCPTWLSRSLAGLKPCPT